MSLPKGFKRLEWIKADGASYINTNFAPNQDTRVYAECELPISASSNQGLFGARVSSSSSAFQFVTQGGYYRSDYNGTLTTISSSDYGTAKFYVDKNKSQTNLNGQYSGSAAYAAFSCPHSMYIFATNNNGSLYAQSSAKLFVMKIYDNGTLVRDYIPCQNASGAIGLWDAANEVFYGNAGTGKFIAGPEVQTVPKAPENFRVEAEADTHVTLAWDASEDVLGYRLYRSGQPLADTTETTATVTVETFAGAVFTVTAYNENGEGVGAELTYFNAPNDPMPFLVTDRTQRDVTERNPKGYYAASDLNRVGYAMKYVADRIAEAGIAISVSPRTDWTDEMWMDKTDAAAYLADLSAIRNAMSVFSATPAAPSGMANLTYEAANNIEQILLDVDLVLTYVYVNLLYAGEIFAGEV